MKQLGDFLWQLAIDNRGTIEIIVGLALSALVGWLRIIKAKQDAKIAEVTKTADSAKQALDVTTLAIEPTGKDSDIKIAVTALKQSLSDTAKDALETSIQAARNEMKPPTEGKV